MRLACMIAATLCLSSVACSEEPLPGWTRVVAVDQDSIWFVYADRLR
jgi:hypothetical protein